MSGKLIGNIFQAMIDVMADVAPIAKERRNTGQGYNFRGVDEVYQGLQHIMAKHGVISLPTVLDERSEERQTKSGGVSIYRILKIRYDFYAADGSTVSATVIGEGMDSGDKASNKAMSVADKYCLLQAFKIPTAEPKDPENENHEILGKGDIKGSPVKDAIIPIYRGVTNTEKGELSRLAGRHGITKVPDLIAINKACIGLEMNQLEAAVVKWKGQQVTGKCII